MRQVDVIRDNADKIMPWLSAHKNTGRRYTYEEILLNLGLPADKNMRSTLSKFVNGQGIRRRKLSHRGEKVVTEGNFIPVRNEATPAAKQVELFIKDMFKQTDKERFLSACRAFADIYFKED